MQALLIVLTMLMSSFMRVDNVNAQSVQEHVYLPMLAGGYSMQSSSSGPIVNAAVAEPVDLGCVNYSFWTHYDDDSFQWNGNWLIGRGNSGAIVLVIQQRLVRTFNKDLGNFGQHGDGVDGHFGWRTERAVREVQQQYRDWGYYACGRPIFVDGVVGPQMWAILGE